MGRMRRAAALCLAGLVTATLLPALSANAQATGYQVQVGAFHDRTASESMRFFPSRMTVHQGDTITFAGGFHTATLLPAGTDAQAWTDENVIANGAEWAPFVPDPDEGSSGLKFNNRVAFPSDPTCGSAEEPCSYDGTSVVNSGVFVFGPGSFTTTVNAAPGESFWVICLIHVNMRMRVTVVPDAEAATTQESIDEGKQQLIARDEDEAAALRARLARRRSKHTTASGKTVWDSWVGYDLPGVSLFGMFPERLRIGKGDTVRYHFASLEYEIHTATFPTNKALNIANGSFMPSCDLDGDSGAEPDSPPQMEGPPFCEDPSTLELDLHRRMNATGDGVLRSASDFENSGIRGDYFSRAAWDVKFARRSPDGGFKYVCMIHPNMRGRVVVK